MEQDTQAIPATKAEAKPTAKKFTLQEKVALCKQWYSSGLRKSNFAKQHGIRPAIFTQWTLRLVQKYLPKKPLHQSSSAKTIAPNSTWVPITVKASDSTTIPAASFIETTVVLPQGVSLMLKLNTQQLQDLIKGFGNGISTK